MVLCRKRGGLGPPPQVKICFHCQTECIFNTDDPYLLASHTDQANFRNTNPVIDPGFDADGASSSTRNYSFYRCNSVTSLHFA